MYRNQRMVDVDPTGRVAYKHGGRGVAGVLGAQPLSPQHPYFELRVDDPGRRATIAIGVSHRGYALTSQPGTVHTPGWVLCCLAAGGTCSCVDIGTLRLRVARAPFPGWRAGSIGFHCDDGKVFAASGSGVRGGPTSGRGDVVGCGAEFAGTPASHAPNGEWRSRADKLRDAHLTRRLASQVHLLHPERDPRLPRQAAHLGCTVPARGPALGGRASHHQLFRAQPRRAAARTCVPPCSAGTSGGRRRGPVRPWCAASR